MQVETSKARYYRLLSDSGNLFWILQVLGWFGVSLVTYVSLSLPYDQFEVAYLAHNLIQSVLGLLLSLPLRYIFRAVWHWSLVPRSLIVIGSAIAVSALWSVLRLILFMVMTGERGLWGDFGGWVFPSIFVFLTWAALYHGVKYYQLLQREHETLMNIESRKREEALVLTQARAEARDAQLKLLRYQLNPHFLFNTLNSVASLINMGRSSDATVMLGRLSEFLRFTLEGEAEALVTLEHELRTLDRYLRIEQVRFADRLQLEFLNDDETKTLAVPSLILQPLAENAIKYAIGASEAGGVIRIRSELIAERLLLSVEDTGSDRDEQMRGQDGSLGGSGIGLVNTRARLENLYGDSYRLDVGPSTLGGLCFQISLPAAAVL